MAEARTTRTPGDFFLEHGRLPLLGDEIPPWHYRGWLLAYLLDLHEQMGRFNVGFGDRWGYVSRIRETGKLPDEPPPQIKFDRRAPEAKDAYKNLEKCVDICFHDRGSWSALNDFLRWLAWGCGFSTEFPDLSEQTQEALYRTYDAKPALLAPYDYFGQLMSERKAKGWNPNAFYPTPHEVVECMTRMTFDDPGRESGDWRKLLATTVCDPCVGTGRMLLHASNYSLRLMGTDIDAMCVLATQINGCLYAPWLTYPLPDEIFVEVEEGASQPIMLSYDPRPRYKDQAVLFS